MLKLADNLKLPLDVVTQTMAILAKRRAGKSYTMRRLVEQLVNASQQVVLVDPKGDQWGIRSSADGKGAGLPLVILGGERADVPLEPTSGELVAKLVVEERVSCVIDLSLFRKHEVATFMTGLLENLYRLKAREQFRTPMMLVIDEADAVAPQKPQKGEERMLGAAEDIVRRGGQRGIGCVLVSQRSAVLNKNVLTQAQILVALRTIAPQDLDAMKAWIDVHGSDEERRTLMESLPSLPVGDAWFWSPGWPDVDGIFKRVHVLPIETFDSGATPKPGEKRREPKTVADIDLDALKRQMSAAIEKAKADDPRELRKQIAELQRQLKTRTAPPAPPAAKEKRIEIPVIKDAQLTRLEHAIGRYELVADAIAKSHGTLVAALVSARSALHASRLPAPGAPPRRHDAVPAVDRAAVPQARRDAGVRRRPPADGAPGELAVPEQRILDSLAWWDAAGIEQPTRHQVAFGARYSVNGHFNNVVGTLNAKGLVVYPKGNHVALTDEGRKLAVAPDVPADRHGLIEMVRSVLRTEPQRRVFNVLVNLEGGPLTREELAQHALYSVNGHFNNVVGSLKSLGVVEYPRGNHVALGEMFNGVPA